MKKLIFIAAILFATTAYSQIGSASTTLTVTIAEVYSIEVNQASVNIPINQVSHFVDGNSSENINHITLTATGGYNVTAKALTNITGTTESIDISKLGITIADNGGADIITNLPLSLSEQTIITETNGNLERNLDVEYILQGGEYLTQLPAGAYQTTIIYEITLD